MFLYKNFMGARKKDLTDIKDIIRNINFVLGSKRGISSFLRDFGMGDIGETLTGTISAHLVDDIVRVLNKYEPRIEVTNAEGFPGDKSGEIILRVEVKLRSSGEPFSLDMDPSSCEVRLSDVGSFGGS